MRYRRLDASGDYTFGKGPATFYVDSPEAVAQLCQTRLALYLGEWFLDTSDGTPWNTEVLGTGTGATRDPVLVERITETPGVLEILGYASSFDHATRRFHVTVKVMTIYGPTVVQVLVP